MSETLKLPYFTIKSEELANWLDAQPDSWWNVDGDPVLTSRVDFPCPSEELSAELRRVDKSLRMFDPRKDSTANGDPVAIAELDKIADRGNNSSERTYLLCWNGEDIQWLLAEDTAAAKDSP